VAVGGDADRRGVITTANYVAREYGVRSAMPSAHARRLCPGLLIIPPDFDKYRAASRQIRGIFYDYTDLVEPLSLDEAYLDVSEAEVCRGSATLIAREIRHRVREEVGITVSTGVAPNKFIAKVASDWNKPDGEFVVLPEEVDAFVAALPVRRIFGVGKATAERLARMGVESCAELRAFTVFELTERFGRFGQRLHELCRGIDLREVESSQRRKSLSVERTYAEDLRGLEACRRQLPELVFSLRSRLRRVDADYLVTKLHLKLKFADFQSTSVECSGRLPEEVRFEQLLEQALERSPLPVRLLGVGVRFVDLRELRNPAQLELFERA
jgi:DNA polymerase-4